jgi:drug/metabolite transporter (DMT)-like permease
VGPTRASIISTLEPVFTALLAVLLLGERLTLLQTGGIALVVLGAVAAQVKEGPRSVTKAA